MHSHPPGVGGGGGVTFRGPAHVSGGCLQPAWLSHWLAAASPSELQLRSALQTAGGMCRVLFLCIGLMGCHGSSCVPQEQSQNWLSLFFFFLVWQ